MSYLLSALPALAVAALHYVLMGFVIEQMWAWYVVPLGAVPIGYIQAIGLTLMMELVTLGNTPYSESDSDFWKRIAVSGFIVPAFILMTGYLLHLM